MRDKTSIELLAEAAANNGVSVDDFYAYMPMHSYIYARRARCGRRVASTPASRLFPGPDNKSVAASAWIDQHRPVEQMTWCPGLPI